MARLLFVVHRYYPYAGGSEHHVRCMAEECVQRGHEVGVLAGEHKGDQNGVMVSSDANWLLQRWDLVIVHGADVGVQNFELANAPNIPNPILYLLILPSGSDASRRALQDCKYVGWCTNEDLAYVNQHGVANKSFQVRYGIDHGMSIGKAGFKEKHGIKPGRMFLSCGGYWPNKAMKELAEVFVKADLKDSILVTTGYDNRHDLMPAPRDNVIPLMIDDHADVLSAMKEADCYIMHSFVEGFGLVLVECMLNETPWIARHGSGAALMKDWGQTYRTDDELISLLRRYDSIAWDLGGAREFAIANHISARTVDDIEVVLRDAIANGR